MCNFSFNWASIKYQANAELKATQRNWTREQFVKMDSEADSFADAEEKSQNANLVL
jgi:hypothetical protein